MLKLTFKYVGHGDTITLEWVDSGSKRIAIIDCKHSSNGNPIIPLLKKEGFSEIEFIVLSHPHFDHISGFLDLLIFCEKNNIIIKSFYTTCAEVPEYLRSATSSHTDKKYLSQLFKYIKELRNSRIIMCYNSITDFSQNLFSNNNFQVKCLSPSEKEKLEYITSRKDYLIPESGNNPKANWIATVLKIYGKNWFILLTSDAIRESMKRLGINERKDPVNFNEDMIIAQSPHHGSKENHYPAFWKHQIAKKTIPISYSVGPNKYGHPDISTIRSFTILGYQNCYTFPLANLIEKTSDGLEGYLDLISSKIPSEGKDLKYEIDTNGLIINTF